MKLRTALIATATTMLLTAGCYSRLAKEGLGSVRGARGQAQAIDGPELLTDYASFELGTFTDAMSGMVPPDLFVFLEAAFQKELADANLPRQADGKTLLVRGQVIYYEKAGTFGQLFGPLEEVVARAEFVDKASGTVVGQAYVVGRSQETVNQGVKAKAEGLAKGLVAYIARRYPRDARPNGDR